MADRARVIQEQALETARIGMIICMEMEMKLRVHGGDKKEEVARERKNFKKDIVASLEDT